MNINITVVGKVVKLEPSKIACMYVLIEWCSGVENDLAFPQR